MACISPDGKPTESGTRSGLRELTQAGLVIQKEDRYNLTEKGAELIG